VEDTVYVVSYSTGQFSDRYDWPDVWYATRAEAEGHCIKFNVMMKKAVKHFSAPNNEYKWEPVPHPDVMQFVATFNLPDVLRQAPDGTWEVLMYEIADYNQASVAAVPRGTLALHGLEDAK
jgi:hypothetical protein